MSKVNKICLILAIFMSSIMMAGIASAATSSQEVANYAPVQSAIKQAIADGNFSMPDIEGSPEYSVKILEKNDTHIKLISTTKITFKNPRGAGFGNIQVASSDSSFGGGTWPKFQMSASNGNVATANYEDYDQQIKNSILAEINNISDPTKREQKLKEWNNNGYEYGSRTFEFKEIYEVTYPSPALSSEAVSQNSKNILMGFTQPIYWRYTREDNLSIIGIWVAWTKLDAVADAAYGLRLPIMASMQMPSPMIRGGYYNINTYINGQDWNADQYSAANVPPENGNEFVARAKFTLTLQARIMSSKDIGPLYLIDKGVDYGKSFKTPFGQNEQFPLPTLNLSPDMTGLKVSYGNPLISLWIGIGLMIEPKLGSDKITAKWVATGDSTGNGLVEYHSPNTNYNFGPVKADNYDQNTDYANVKLTDYNYYFTLCKLAFKANVQGGLNTIIGSLAIGTPYVDIYSYNCGGTTGGFRLGTHPGTNTNSLTANSIVLKATPSKLTYKTEKKLYNKGDKVIFTLTNNNPYPITLDMNNIQIQNTLTGKVVYQMNVACALIIGNENCNLVTIPQKGSWTWTWDQTDEYNKQVRSGNYIGIWGDYKSNIFVIK